MNKRLTNGESDVLRHLAGVQGLVIRVLSQFVENFGHNFVVLIF
jgi:hypothetical protein